MKEPYNREEFLTRPNAVPEQGPSHRSIGLFEKSIENVFSKKHAKIKEPYRDSHTRCQKGGVPEEGKIHLPYSLFQFFKCVLGAYMSVYPRDAISA